jgi:hypothetical protein
MDRARLLAGALEQICTQLGADPGDRAEALEVLLGPSLWYGGGSEYPAGVLRTLICGDTAIAQGYASQPIPSWSPSNRCRSGGRTVKLR